MQLALQSSYAGSFDSFANASIALVFGVALTAVTCGIVRSLGTGWIASRLLRSNWRTLATVAERKSPGDRVAIASLMQHRLALLAARITVVPAEARRDAANLRQLRTALSIINLRQASRGLSRLTTAAIEELFARLASVFRANAAGRLPDELVGRLDEHDRIDVARTGERGPQRGAYRPCRDSRRAVPRSRAISAARAEQGEMAA